MSKRKLVSEVASGSGGKININNDFLNNLFGDTQDELVGKLELGPTMMDITKGLEIVKQRKNDDMCLSNKYTILMYISRGAVNVAAQFIEIESELTKEEIIDIFFQHLKYKLPGGKRLNKQKKKNGVFSARKYFGRDDADGFDWLEISQDHAYIYIGDSDGKYYPNSIIGARDFIYRRDPENKPTLCSIM